jgi:hypothetical protein
MDTLSCRIEPASCRTDALSCRTGPAELPDGRRVTEWIRGLLNGREGSNENGCQASASHPPGEATHAASYAWATSILSDGVKCASESSWTHQT